MTSFLGRPVTGTILDLPVDPRLVFDYVTQVPYGPPIKPTEKKAKESAKPLTLGDERHSELISAIQNISVSQKVKQDVIQEGLPRNRDWR